MVMMNLQLIKKRFRKKNKIKKYVKKKKKKEKIRKHLVKIFLNFEKNPSSEPEVCDDDGEEWDDERDNF
jgi:hypothetical protein